MSHNTWNPKHLTAVLLGMAIGTTIMAQGAVKVQRKNDGYHLNGTMIELASDAAQEVFDTVELDGMPTNALAFNPEMLVVDADTSVDRQD